MTETLSKCGDGFGKTVYFVTIFANAKEIAGTYTQGRNLSDVPLKDVQGGVLINTTTGKRSVLCVDGPSKTWTELS